MMALIFAAAVAAAQPAPAGTSAPANPHARHMGEMAKMKDCCCEEMMKKMHDGQKMDRAQDHQGHQGHDDSK